MGGEEGKFSVAEDSGGAWDEAVKWFLLGGNRFVVAAGMVALTVVLTYGLDRAGLITVGPSSTMGTLLSSGITSGLLTLVTVTLSINQLLLSRVFGEPEELRTRLDGTVSFRRDIEEIAAIHSSPTDPEAFLRLVMDTLSDRATDLRSEMESHAGEVRTDVTAYVDGLTTYADRVRETVAAEPRAGKSNTADVLSSILGTKYAEGMTAAKHLRSRYDGDLSVEAKAELDTAIELLESVAILRQFFKTLAIQQDLARLSRLIAYTGFLALLTAFYLTLVYKSSSGVVVDPAYLPLVTSVGLGIIVTPLALLLSYVIRIATISRYTVSVGPFVPPEEQFDR